MTSSEKLELVSQVFDRNSIKSVALDEGINVGILCQWVRKYKVLEYNGLIVQKKSENQGNRKKSVRDERKSWIINEIKNIHEKSHEIYGTPKITQELRKQGGTISKRTVG